MRSSSGPRVSTIAPSTASAAAVPAMAGFQPRSVATTSTIVKASTTSTVEARKEAPTAGAAVDQSIIDVAHRFSSCTANTRCA